MNSARALWWLTIEATSTIGPLPTEADRMYFATRMKYNALLEVTEERMPLQHRGILKGQIIRFTREGTQEKCPYLLRRLEAVHEQPART